MRLKWLKKRWQWLLPLTLGALGAMWFLMPLPAPFHGTSDTHPVKILDRNGALLYELRSVDFGAQEFLPIDKIPQELIGILVATEDRTFFKHHGISVRGLLRALWQNFRAKEIVSGGSTLTQQLVRIRLKPKERNYFYKLKEMALALKLESRESKSKILEDYLNEVYCGHQAYGVQAASRIFFNKNIQELSISEMALLVGLIQSPSSYDPFVHFSLAKKRQETVLKSMRDVGMISEDEERALQKEPIYLSGGKINIRAPHFVMWVRSLMGEEALTEIRTTLDLSLQSEAERIVDFQLKKLKDKNVTSGAVVVLDAQTGDVLTMVGSGDYFNAEYDGAVNVALSERQPGSTLKPFTYALALKKGATPATTVEDVETQFFTQEGNPYFPRNYDYGYHGLVRYREALANSFNISAVKVLQRVGIDSLLHFLRQAGITTLNEKPEYYGLALTLGDAEVTLLELAQAYGMLARGGETLSVKVFADQTTKNGDKILDEKIAWLITDILSDPKARLAQFGEGTAFDFDFPVAAKTGTTRNSRDNWMVGYTPERIVGVWVGNANNTPMKNTSGVTGAGPIFHDVMLAATKNISHSGFDRPQRVIQQEICRLSGKRPTPFCPETVQEWFIRGTEPQEPDELFVSVDLDRRNGLQASDLCPVEYIEKRVFTIFPPALRTWARENGWKEPPAAYSPLCQTGGQVSPSKETNQGEGWVVIRQPHAGESFLLDPLIPDHNEKVILEAEGGQNVTSVDWFLNGKKIGSGKKPNYRLEWAPQIGRFRIEAKAAQKSDIVNIDILEP